MDESVLLLFVDENAKIKSGDHFIFFSAREGFLPSCNLSSEIWQAARKLMVEVCLSPRLRVGHFQSPPSPVVEQPIIAHVRCSQIGANLLALMPRDIPGLWKHEHLLPCDPESSFTGKSSEQFWGDQDHSAPYLFLGQCSR